MCCAPLVSSMAPSAQLVKADDPIVLDEQGAFGVALPALAGARDLDANTTAGTIFSISALDRPRALPADAELRAVGMVVYGPKTILVLTVGEGVALFFLKREPDGYVLSADNVRIPGRGNARSTRPIIPAGMRPPAPSSMNSPTPAQRRTWKPDG